MNGHAKLPDPGDGEEVPVGTVASMGEQISAGGIVLIDCREPSEWEFNRLPGARLIPLSRFAELAVPVVRNAVPAVVYCHHGMRSLQAVRWLRSKGLDASWSMTGGIDLWSERIDPGIPKY